MHQKITKLEILDFESKKILQLSQIFINHLKNIFVYLYFINAEGMENICF